MLDIVGNFFPEFLKTFIACLTGDNCCELLKDHLELSVLLEVFEFL